MGLAYVSLTTVRGTEAGFMIELTGCALDADDLDGQ